MQRGRNLLDHRPQAGRCAGDPDRALSAEGRGGRGQRHREIEPIQGGAGRSKEGRKTPNCAPNCAENRQCEIGEIVTRSTRWGGRIRTSEWRNQNPPDSYYLSTRFPKNRRNSTSISSIG